MGIQTISYSDKTALNSNSGVADANKVNATDMNEIKSVVNNNASETSKATNSTVYVTTRVGNQVGTWVDGKTIYRKAIYVPSFPNTTSMTINADLTNLDKIVRLYGIGWGSTNNTFPLPYISPSAQIELVYLSSGDNIRITASDDRSSMTGYIIVEYTKT